MRAFRLLVLGLMTSAALFSAHRAEATSLLLEPYLGYELGKLKYTGTPSSDSDLTSGALGLRLGAAFPILFVAADYSLLVGGSLKNSAGTKVDASGNQLFAEVGAQLPLIRAYLGYGLMNTLQADGTGVSVKYEGGTAIKAGIGTTIMPMLAVNLEYINSKYDKVAGFSTSDMKSDFFMLNISVPLEY